MANPLYTSDEFAEEVKAIIEQTTRPEDTRDMIDWEMETLLISLGYEKGVMAIRRWMNDAFLQQAKGVKEV